MKIGIKLLSYTLSSSGEGAGIIDSDVVLDDLGFPYIPSRRVKGVLKESAKEVCDMLGLEDYSIVKSIFGEDGFVEGKLHIGNLYINDYENIREEVENLKRDKKSTYNIFIHPSQIASYYTSIRQQTSIDEDGEIAKEGSLRTFRVLKPGLKFEGELYEITSLSKKENALLYLAAINLKRIGTSRNRGFGEIKCTIEDIKISSIDDAIQYLNNDNDKNITEEIKSSDSGKFNANKKGNIKKLSYKITILSPIVLAKEIGEQNTINTEKYIPSTTIRGLFANKFIKEFNLSNAAHKDDNFYNLFLKNEILFTSAYPFKKDKTYYPALYLHKEKGEDSDQMYNILEKVPESIKTKPVNKMVYYNSDKIYSHDVSTTFYFHNARNREKGHATGEEIFYYEAINEGEEFKGFIIGDEGYLEEIKRIFGDNFTSFIGRSKSAQYGLVNIEFGDLEDTDDLEDVKDEFIIVATSPVILYNEWGFPDISVKALENYLKKHFDCFNITVEKIIAKTEYVENFIGVWRMKNTRELAYSPGSAFKIKIEGCNDLKEKLNSLLIYGFGEKTELGFGRVKVYSSLEENYERKYDEEDGHKGIIIQYSKAILENIVKQKAEEILKFKAFEKAEDYKNRKETISNNLIGRLEGMLFKTNKFDDWKTKLKDLEKKPAGETLKNLNLWDNLYKLDIFNNNSNEIEFYDKLSKAVGELKIQLDNFNLSKTYWISFFRYLRLFKKQGGEKDE
ncbi:CRISPR-associated protein Csx10 [Thermoanaerobacter uzonensis DSM 18761]|uniref:CRISPR-associated protein Csx10 n=1 Tax=Thermoanaerobacter uzonensis DSM 18761 TaxID=1123369 RepID=A0A1M5AAL4_9THEO|nr:RAMP superfamily CRISPR-associated protein [Thermoanaerobacter uzonensis]SHF27215.1 CRISPR-associated protein Csx10 [Thermoanaerobacter uzonensis DSM 18761]